MALVASDVATTFGYVYPCQSKDTDDTVASLQMFIGDSAVKSFYSDNADDLMSVARFLSIPREASQQGLPQTNGNLEREVQDIISGTRTLLGAAGLPGYCWSVAAPCYMHLNNCMPHPSGKPSPGL